MKKRYAWAVQVKDGRKSIYRFRSLAELHQWVMGDDLVKGEMRMLEYASHPEVRRIQRRMAAGEQITFPVEI